MNLCQINNNKLGFLVVLPRFLRGPLSTQSLGASRAPGPFTLEVALLPSKPLTSFNIQAKVHHVAFELFTWVLQRLDFSKQLKQPFTGLMGNFWMNAQSTTLYTTYTNTAFPQVVKKHVTVICNCYKCRKTMITKCLYLTAICGSICGNQQHACSLFK